MSRFVRILLMTAAFACSAATTMETASACPMCKEANETDDARPRAYMYSILFMLSMPAMMFSGFGIAFYRLSKRAQLAQQQEIAAQESASADLRDASLPPEDA